MSRFPPAAAAFVLFAAASAGLAACSDPETSYRDALKADLDRYEQTGAVPPAQDVPQPSRSAKAEALAEMGGRATPDDIRGRPGDDPAALREVKESFVAYYNLPHGAAGEREAWVRFMHALERAEQARKTPS